MGELSQSLGLGEVYCVGLEIGFTSRVGHGPRIHTEEDSCC